MIQILGGLGGGGDSDTLNKELAAQTDGGSLFNSPFGDKTFFTTNTGGKIMLMFTFDPDRSYDSTYQMASILGDYAAGLRRALTKQLLNEDPKKPTLEESIWTHLKTVLSPPAFTELLKQDTKRLHEYVAAISEEAKVDYVEEKKLTEAMSTRDFNFRFEIAIDAYPAKVASNRASRELPPSRKGVLTFYIQGDPTGTIRTEEGSGSTEDAKEPEAPHLEDSITSDEKSTKKKARKRSRSPSPQNTAGAKKAKKGGKDTSRGTESQAQMKALSKRLNLASTEAWSSLPVYIKKFDSAFDFFDAADKWFLSSIKAQSERLQADKRNSAASHLYH